MTSNPTKSTQTKHLYPRWNFDVSRLRWKRFQWIERKTKQNGFKSNKLRHGSQIRIVANQPSPADFHTANFKLGILTNLLDLVRTYVRATYIIDACGVLNETLSMFEKQYPRKLIRTKRCATQKGMFDVTEPVHVARHVEIQSGM